VITDIFARRYAKITLRTQYFEEDRRFMNQAAAMVMDPLWLGRSSDSPSETTEKCIKEVHDIIALEVGRDFLSDRWWFQTGSFNGNPYRTPHQNSYAAISKTYLTKMPADFTQGDAWVKERLSFIEIAFQRRQAQVQEANRNLAADLAKAQSSDDLQQLGRALNIPGLQVDGIKAKNTHINNAFAELVHDLNERLRLALYNLSFHNGLIQLVGDEQINNEVAKPFWGLVASEPWRNVDLQIKEAIDRRDNGDRTAAFHAVMALESCIKIISNLKGWTTGRERGAANYVNNLVSQDNGRFIEVWEGDLLTKMFSDVRNPFAHGPGQEPMALLSKEQTAWAIDTAMVWIKSLIRRM
jgi:hypothetical protein